MKTKRHNNSRQNNIFRFYFTKQYWSINSLLALMFLLVSSQSAAVLNLAVETSLSPAAPSERLMVKVTVTNPTGSTVSNVRIEMPYPVDLIDLSDSLISDGGDCTNMSGSNSECDSGETIFWDIANLPPGTGKTVYFPPVINGSAGEGAMIIFAAEVFENGSSQANASQVVEVLSDRTFSLSIDANHEPVSANDKLTYDITYGHRGATATTGSEIRFAIPNGTTFDSAEDGGILIGNEVVWDLGLIFPSKGGKRRVVVKLDVGVNPGHILTVDSATITGTANFFLHQASGNIATRVGSVSQFDFQIAINADPVRLRDDLRTQLTITNRSAANLTGIKIEFYFPGGLSNLPSSGLLDGGACPNATCNSGETVTWDLSDLVVGSSKTIFIAPVSSDSNPSGRLIPIMARASTNETASRWERRTILVDATRKFDLAVDTSQDPVRQNSRIIYDISYGHAVGAASSMTEIRFPIPVGADFVAADRNGILVKTGDPPALLGRHP